jgi:hypothetical protein
MVIAKSVALLFTKITSTAMFLFGVGDAWDGDSMKASMPQASLSMDLRTIYDHVSYAGWRVHSRHHSLIVSCAFLLDFLYLIPF